MRTAGVVSEFDPFHNGHSYFIGQLREKGFTHIVTVMSGSFTQRGGCAMMGKFLRAKAAAYGGVDLVIEIPQVYACASAERFAYGAVSILEGCGCIDSLAFGSECGDIELVKAAAKLPDDERTRAACVTYMQQGMSYPRALQRAVTDCCGSKALSELLASPNDTLGIEYVRTLNKIGSGIEPICVKRVGAAHDSEETSGSFASASAVRSMILNGDYSYINHVPPSTAEIINNAIAQERCPASFENNERGVLSVLRRMTVEDMKRVPDVTEGLENRIFRAVRECNSISEIISAVKCKRYTYARLSRIITCMYLGITIGDLLPPQYIRVLAMTKNGTELLRRMKETASLPVITAARDFSRLSFDAQKMLEADIRAADMHNLCTPVIFPCGEDYCFKTTVL